MPRDAGKCYIEFKETGENLSCSVVSRFDARSLFLRVVDSWKLFVGAISRGKGFRGTRFIPPVVHRLRVNLTVSRSRGRDQRGIIKSDAHFCSFRSVGVLDTYTVSRRCTLQFALAKEDVATRNRDGSFPSDRRVYI